MSRINFSKIELVSSNPKKIEEYVQYGLPLRVSQGMDLPEVAGTSLEVIIHKAILAGKNKLVEDVSLEIQGLDVGVNIRWLSEEIRKRPELNGRKAQWITMLGLYYNEKIYICKGIVEGTLDFSDQVESQFGFDSIFVPKGNKYTLHRLKELGKKDLFSARKKAIEALLSSNFYKVFPRKEIPKWTGKYQQD